MIYVINRALKMKKNIQKLQLKKKSSKHKNWNVSKFFNHIQQIWKSECLKHNTTCIWYRSQDMQISFRFDAKLLQPCSTGNEMR